MSVAIQDQILEVDAYSLKQQLDQGSVILVDVREPAEYKSERIQGAVNLPLSRFNPEQLPAIPAGKTLVLQCQSGNRSEQAARKLIEAGYGSVTHLAMGIIGWKTAKLPVTSGGHQAIPLMRQVQITAGSLVVIGTLLGAIVSPWWLILPGFVGSGLVFAGISGTCGMAMVLAKMPWNQA